MTRRTANMRIDYLPPLPTRLQRERIARFYAVGCKVLLYAVVLGMLAEAYILWSI